MLPGFFVWSLGACSVLKSLMGTKFAKLQGRLFPPKPLRFSPLPGGGAFFSGYPAICQGFLKALNSCHRYEDLCNKMEDTFPELAKNSLL
jgi:hypothetical protein